MTWMLRKHIRASFALNFAGAFASSDSTWAVLIVLSGLANRRRLVPMAWNMLYHNAQEICD